MIITRSISPPRLRRVAAYMMMEVLVAVAIMAIAFVSLYAGMSTGFAITQVVRENLRGTQILVERVEGIRLFNWNQLNDTNLLPRAFTTYFYPLATTNQSKGITYTGTVDLVPNPALNPSATYANEMKMIKVTVSWTSGNMPRTRSMTTYVARNGVQNYIYSN